MPAMGGPVPDDDLPEAALQEDIDKWTEDLLVQHPGGLRIRSRRGFLPARRTNLLTIPYLAQLIGQGERIERLRDHRRGAQ